MTDDSASQGVQEGWHLWLAGIIGVAWNGFGCLDFAMTTSRNEAWLKPYPREMIDYWYSMPWWMYGIWAVGVFGALFASVALLMKSEAAVTLFAAAFAASLISFYIGWTNKDAPRMDGMDLMPTVTMGLGFGFFIYAYWQSRRGVLR